MENVNKYEDILKDRTKKFALQIIKLVEDLPKSNTGRVIGNQLLRSGTSIGANYRAACRGRSKPEFISKLGIVVEEADESSFWLELIKDGDIFKKPIVDKLLKESKELTAIFTASIKSARRNLKTIM